MNRKILFRGKRTDNGEWVEGYLFCCWNQTYIIREMIKNNPAMKEIAPETVCQYTGLTDKNGKEIFEGDIIRYMDKSIGKETFDKVEYNETYAAFCRLHKSEMGLQYLFLNQSIANKCEIIGNIFDNPKLLEGGEGN